MRNFIKVHLRDFKFGKHESIFFMLNVWSLYNLIGRAFGDKLRSFFADTSMHPSLLMHYDVLVDTGLVAESFALSTYVGGNFLSVDLRQSLEHLSVQVPAVSITKQQIEVAFDRFMLVNGNTKYDTDEALVKVDIQTISYRLRPMLIDLVTEGTTGRVDVTDTNFSLSLQQTGDSMHNSVTVRLFNNNSTNNM